MFADSWVQVRKLEAFRLHFAVWTETAAVTVISRAPLSLVLADAFASTVFVTETVAATVFAHFPLPLVHAQSRGLAGLLRRGHCQCNLCTCSSADGARTEQGRCWASWLKKYVEPKLPTSLMHWLGSHHALRALTQLQQEAMPCPVHTQAWASSVMEDSSNF